ncbi:MAG: von Willebrand factor type A domain-containing protein [Planctomycetota bacterium]
MSTTTPDGADPRPPVAGESRPVDLCAYLLGELAEQERRAVEAALARSPALAAERDRLVSTIGVVRDAFPPEGLSPEALAELLRRVAAPPPRVAFLRGGGGLLRVAATVALLAGGWLALRATLEAPAPGGDEVASARGATRPAPSAAQEPGDTRFTGEALAEVEPAAELDAPAEGEELADRVDLVAGGDQFHGPGDAVPPAAPLEAPAAEEGAPAATEGLALRLEAAGEAGGAGPAVPGPPAPGAGPGGPPAEAVAGGAEAKAGLAAAGHDDRSSLLDSLPEDFARDDPCAKLDEALQALGYVVGHAGAADQDEDRAADKKAREAAEKDAAAGFFLGRGARRAAATPAEIARLTAQVLESCRPRPGESDGAMFFRFWGDHPFVPTAMDSESTFPIAVDTASYAGARQCLNDGHLPALTEIGTEAFLNCFRPDVPAPAEGEVFAIAVEMAPSRFAADPALAMLRVAVRGREADPLVRAPIARDVEVRVAFDPAQVESYRQLGYEGRVPAGAPSRPPEANAGEVNAGQQVSALYELRLPPGRQEAGAPLAQVRLRHRAPDPIAPGDPNVAGRRWAEQATEITRTFSLRDAAASFAGTSLGYRRAVLAAQFAEVLRRSVHAAGDSYDELVAEAGRLNEELHDPDFAEFCLLLEKARPLLAAEEAAPRDELLQTIDELRRRQLAGNRGLDDAARAETERLEARVRTLIHDRLAPPAAEAGDGR